MFPSVCCYFKSMTDRQTDRQSRCWHTCPGPGLTSWTVSPCSPPLPGPAGRPLRAPLLPGRDAASGPGRCPAESRRHAPQSARYSAFASLEALKTQILTGGQATGPRACQRGGGRYAAGGAALRAGEDGAESPLRLELSAFTEVRRAADQPGAAAANHRAETRPRALTVLRPRPRGSVGETTTKTKRLWKSEKTEIVHGAFRCTS